MAIKLPKWLDKIGRLFTDPYYSIEVSPKPGTTTRRESDDLTKSVFGSFEADLTLGVSDRDGDLYIPSRSEQVRMSRLMHQVDPRIGEIVDRIVADTVAGEWEWDTPTSIPESRREDLIKRLDEITERLEIKEKLKDWVTSAFVDGDLFLQFVMSGPEKVSELHDLPALSMERNSNEYDDFDNPKEAFTQYTHGVRIDDYGLNYNEEYGAWSSYVFEAFEILHARTRHISRHRYGRPLLFRAIRSARWLLLAETDIGQRRRERATMRRKMIIGSPEHQPSVQEINDWQNKFIEMKSKGSEGKEEDLFLPYWVDVKNLDGDETIKITEDIKYHVDATYAGTGLPKMLHGFLDDVNRDITEPVLDQYVRVISERSKWISDKIIRPAVRRVLLLEGYPVEKHEMMIQWSSRTAYSVDDIKTAVETSVMAFTGNIWDIEAALDYIKMYVTDMDKESIMERMMSATAETVEETSEEIIEEVI